MPTFIYTHDTHTDRHTKLEHITEVVLNHTAQLGIGVVHIKQHF